MSVWLICYQMCTDPREPGSATLVRTIVPDNSIAIPLFKLLQHFKWSRVGILSEDNHSWTRRIKYLNTYFAANGIKVGLDKTVLSSHVYNRTKHQSQLRSALKDLKGEANSK